MRIKWFWTLVLLSSVWGCGASRNYWMDIQYLSDPVSKHGGKGRVVAINAFKDIREDRNQLGTWLRPRGQVVTFVASKPVDQAVTEAISRYFRLRGYQVVSSTGWDLRPESLSRIPAELVVGGEIIHLKSEAWTTVRTKVQVHVQLQIYVGKVSEGKVLGQKMEISKEILGVTSRPERVEDTLNKELSEAIDRVFQGIL